MLRSVRHTSPVAARSDEPAIDADQKATVRDALLSLPEDQFQLVTLKHYDTHTFSSLSRALSLPLGTVKTRYYAAIRKLRDFIKEDPRS